MSVLIPSPMGSPVAKTGRCGVDLLLPGAWHTVGRFRLSTDPLGVFTLRFSNIVANSRVRVETVDDGTTIDEFVAAGTPTEDRALAIYASGNPRNDLRIKVRNASGAPAYRPFETQATAQLGVVTVYVFQEFDE